MSGPRGRVGPALPDMGPLLSLWLMLGLLRDFAGGPDLVVVLGKSWNYVGPMLGPCWTVLGSCGPC